MVTKKKERKRGAFVRAAGRLNSPFPSCVTCEARATSPLSPDSAILPRRKFRFNVFASRRATLGEPSRISSSFATWRRNFQRVSFAAIQNGAFAGAHPSSIPRSSNLRQQHGGRCRVIVIATRSFGKQYASGRIEIRYCDELGVFAMRQVRPSFWRALPRIGSVHVTIRPRCDLNHAGMSGEIHFGPSR